ncbi:TIGR03089 family protein [Gandjariella thermophila]|uniref:TIGR03089 family protein n=1 Tax=Gandjariella thermophila TaxID=1931992 RepID=A0A4D4JA68_9PSEU|nr:TIGR03089 family protein [Gandjariella thermophila]GDY31336.1 TIGR03089 family protein [Gandjariella thermophila]
MTVTEKLFLPLVTADPGRPLITHYDDALGSRVELSGATLANWAAKTANWLRDEHDVEPGTAVAVRLPAHWQTAGVLLGAWWCGAHVVDDQAGAAVAFVTPDTAAADADLVAVVSLDPMGRGLDHEPAGGAIDYLVDVRAHPDDFVALDPVPGETPALLGSTVDDVVARAADRAAALGITAGARVMSTLDWSLPDGVLDGLLAVLAGRASLVQCGNADPAALPARRSTERTTVDLGGPATGTS